MASKLPRSLLSALVFGLMLAHAAPSRAQKTGEAPTGETAQRASIRLDKLFERLKEAENAQAAKTVASEIERALDRAKSLIAAAASSQVAA